MELRQLEYLVAVAEEANFTRAAERIHVSQPAVSAQIQRWSASWTDPAGSVARAVRLTAAGEVVLRRMPGPPWPPSDDGVAGDEYGPLGARHRHHRTVTFHNVDMPELLADFHETSRRRDNPSAQTFRRPDRECQDWSPRPRDRVGGPGRGARRAHVEVVTDEAIEAAVCLTDPLASGRSPACRPARQHADRTPVGAGIRTSSTAHARGGFSPRIAFEASTPLALADLAGRGLGVAIVPTWCRVAAATCMR